MTDLKKEMCYKQSPSACPKCGHARYVVIDMNASIYTTNGEGEVNRHKELRNSTVGKCLNCGEEYTMISVSGMFIPMTYLRSILGGFGYIAKDEVCIIENPMLEATIPNEIE